MANRPAIISKADATRLLKAARDSGFRRARVTAHPDGRIEVEADDPPEGSPAAKGEWDEVLH